MTERLAGACSRHPWRTIAGWGVALVLAFACIAVLLPGNLTFVLRWTQNTDLLRFSSAYRVIIALPDSGRNANAGWYADWIDGSRQWESFHIKDVIPYIERTFHGNGKRAIAGLSMGGYGAMFYAASHPGM